MVLKTVSRSLMMAASVVCATSPVFAGGFVRGTADTDLLYEEGNFNMRAGVSIVAPQRNYETINGAAATDGKFTDTYAVPSAAYKINLTDDARCAGTYTISNGGDASYGMQAIIAGLADGTGTSDRHFKTNEFGMTCGYKFDGVGPGRLWLLGGVFGEDFSYSETVRMLDGATLAAVGHPLAAFGGAAPMANSGTLAFDGGYQMGYRLGIAYEVPEIALRAQLVYRSQVNHTANGTFRFFDTTTGATLFGGAAVLPTRGWGSLPQSVELKLQSGVAEGTLAFLNVKWTDWSVLQRLNYTIDARALGGAVVPTGLEYFWKDGWTVTAGMGRQLTDNIAGSVSLTWDQGVSTTEDAFTDTWTLASGVSMKDERGGEFRAGAAVSYLTGKSVAREAVPGGGGPGDTFAYTVNGDWSVAFGGGYSVKW